MLDLNTIKTTLSSVYDKYNDIKLGIAGSYATNTATENSDLDIVIDGDSTQIEIAEYIKSLFSIPVDVLWVDLLKQDDEELDSLAVKNGLKPNEFSVYKTVMQEVQWYG